MHEAGETITEFYLVRVSGRKLIPWLLVLVLGATAKNANCAFRRRQI